MLFLCKWNDEEESLLLDARDERDARAHAADLNDHAEPDEVLALAPGAFAADVSIDDHGVLMVEPLAGFGETLAKLHDPDAVALEAVEDDEDEEEDEDEGPCGAAAEEQGIEYTCTLQAGHEGDHETREGRALLATWPQ